MCKLDILDPALLQPGQLDWKVEFRLPDLESWTQIFEIHAQTMNCEWGICFELLSHLCPNSIGLGPFVLASSKLCGNMN
jgi:26S proteasome regulatory subunit T1